MDIEAVPVRMGRMSDATKKRGTTKDAAFERVRAICLALPDAAEATNHGRPCFTVRDKTFVMFMDDHHGDGRLAIWCKATPDAQRMLVDSDPERFFVPPYVGPRGWVGARLDRRPEWGAVAAIIEEAHTLAAPKRAVRTNASSKRPRAEPRPRASSKKASSRAASGNR
jgi:hypothetical protein